MHTCMLVCMRVCANIYNSLSNVCFLISETCKLDYVSAADDVMLMKNAAEQQHNRYLRHI